jgi:hypothetical protein
VSRRADPERIYEARRAAIRNRLIDEHRMAPELAEQWIRAWEVDAIDRGIERHSSVFWDGAEAWVAEKRSDRQSVNG